MSHEKKPFTVSGAVRSARDSMLEDFARLALAVTTTNAWRKVNAAVMKPTLIVSAVVKEKRDEAMADVLEKLNMPSRQEVTNVAQRLTRIEMALDDIGAGLDQLRKQSAAPRPQLSNGHGHDRPVKEA
ncbi:MAG TPA: hypothetical protein VGH20_09750 [Myxococcales bacterium]|jgi:uncharacterized membrane protein